MTVAKKLELTSLIPAPLLIALGALLATGSAACGALGQYGSMVAQPQPGAATPGAASPGTTPATPATAAPEAAAAAEPSVVSVDIKNSCSKTVKVFFGSKPKFGSGTYSSASSNSRMSHSFKPGEQFWIVDDSENGVSNVTVGAASKEIEILSSCSELALR